MVAQRLQRMVATFYKACIQRRGGAKQQHEQPAAAAEVANQPEVLVRLEILQAAGSRQQLLPLLPETVGQRVVVVGARDTLHDTTIANRQTMTVNVLEAPDVRAAVVSDRNTIIT